MKPRVRKDVKKMLSEDHTCYVLITCSDPSDEGRMEVEMTYEGDPTLAGYLLQSAQSFIEDEDDEDLTCLEDMNSSLNNK
jgi:hypothetical protein